MKKIFSFVLLTCVASLPLLAQPKIVAHRGYWKTEGSAQNSLTSLQKANDVGCYGSEFVYGTKTECKTSTSTKYGTANTRTPTSCSGGSSPTCKKESC